MIPSEPDSVLIIETQQTDVYRNLAVEEFLLERGGQGPSLLLCRNRPAVVIGKNQNPWRECRIDRLRALGVVLARRISGGGAVYHDLGNLNYSLIYPRSTYRADEAFGLVISALDEVGVCARLERKNALTVKDRKVSGNAFAFRRASVLHNGTLLVSADLHRIHSLFPGDLEVEESHAVASVPALTANLADFCPGLDWRVLADVLANQFCRRYGPARRVGDAEMEDWNLREYMERQRDRAWIYGRTPPFTIVLSSGLRLRVEEGVVRALRLSVASANRLAQETIVREWVGRDFDEIAGQLRALL